MNPNYAAKVKEEIDKLLRGFIRPVKQATWLSPIVVVPKKNGKIRVCVDYRKLNATTVMDAFPLPFTDRVLDAVTGHEVYSFLDGFSGYNQIRMRLANEEKTAFVICIGSNDVRVEDGPNNIRGDHNGDIWRIHPWVYAGVPRRFCGIQPANGTPRPPSVMPREV